MPRVFLSHSSQDKFFVRELAERLQAVGVDVWLDEAEIKVGESLTEKIGRAIDETDHVAVILSQNSVNSEWVQRELEIALQKELKQRGVVVLPLLLEHVEVPPFLRDKLYADFSTPELYEQNFPKLLDALGVLRDATPPTPLKPKPTETPAVANLTESERRLASFEDIRIVDLDEHRTHNPDPSKLLYNMYLKLSGTPPSEWRQIFDAERRFPRHNMWRRAWVEEDYIVVYCVPDELQKYHLRDLKQDTGNANNKYRAYLTEVAQHEAREAQKREAARASIRDVKRRLDFD